jgi:hypothetical protein
MYVLNLKSQDDSPNLKLMATGHMHGSRFAFTDKEERILSINNVRNIPECQLRRFQKTFSYRSALKNNHLYIYIYIYIYIM